MGVASWLNITHLNCIAWHQKKSRCFFSLKSSAAGSETSKPAAVRAIATISKTFARVTGMKLHTATAQTEHHAEQIKAATGCL